MLNELPERIHPRGERRVYYETKKLEVGKEVIVKLATPNMKKVTITLKEFGYGLYYFDFDFADLGDHIGTFFENGENMGSGIFRISF